MGVFAAERGVKLVPHQSGMLKFLLSLALTLLLVPMRAATQSLTPGTYRVWLCPIACGVADSSRAISSALLVLLDDATAATDTARTALNALPSILRKGATAPRPNACFRVLSRTARVREEELFFGIQPIGATRWQHDSTGGFTLRVYASPDAGYTLRWTNGGPLMAGEGWSYGWQGQVRDHRNAFFAASRIGAASITQCAHN